MSKFVTGVCCSAAVLLFSALAGAENLLLEEFVAGERLTENLPNTAIWYTAYASSGVSDSSGELVSADNRHTLAYFTASGSPQELIVGSSLVVSFSFSLDTPVTSTTGFRVGLFNSGGSRISGDNAGSSAAEFMNYTGYAAFFNLNAPTAMRLEERNSGIGSKLIHSGDSYTDHTGDTGNGVTFVSGQTYLVTLQLTRTASGVRISAQQDGADGYSATYTDTLGHIETAFDTFVIYGAGSALDGYTLKQVDIQYNRPRIVSLVVITGK